MIPFSKRKTQVAPNDRLQETNQGSKSHLARCVVAEKYAADWNGKEKYCPKERTSNKLPCRYQPARAQRNDRKPTSQARVSFELSTIISDRKIAWTNAVGKVQPNQRQQTNRHCRVPGRHAAIQGARAQRARLLDELPPDPLVGTATNHEEEEIVQLLAAANENELKEEQQDSDQGRVAPEDAEREGHWVLGENCWVPGHGAWQSPAVRAGGTNAVLAAAMRPRGHTALLQGPVPVTSHQVASLSPVQGPQGLGQLRRRGNENDAE